MGKIYQVKVNEHIYEVEVEFISDNGSSLTTPTINTNSVPVVVSQSAPVPTITPQQISNGTPISAPMQGNIWKVVKKIGDTVKAGETVIILEAMKMENNIVSPKDSTISNILVKEGDTVESGAILVELA